MVFIIDTETNVSCVDLGLEGNSQAPNFFTLSGYPVTMKQPETVCLEINGSSLDLPKKRCASKDISCCSLCFLNKSMSHKADPDMC